MHKVIDTRWRTIGHLPEFRAAGAQTIIRNFTQGYREARAHDHQHGATIKTTEVLNSRPGNKTFTAELVWCVIRATRSAIYPA